MTSAAKPIRFSFTIKLFKNQVKGITILSEGVISLPKEIVTKKIPTVNLYNMWGDCIQPPTTSSAPRGL